MVQSTAQIIESVGLIPVLRARNAGQAHAVVQAMLAGGVTVVEVTMTVPGAVDILKELKSEYGGRLLLGSGTVTTAAEAEATIHAGAEFVVSPSLHPDVIAVTKAAGKLSVPGALTPTEVMVAWKAGSDFVKIFPCSAVGGPAYIRTLRGPFPEIRFIASGGVNQATVAEYIHAGAVAVGIGGDLIHQDAIHRRERDWIRELSRRYTTIIKQTREQRNAAV